MNLEMSLIKATKEIRIDNEVLKKIEEVASIMKTLTKELGEIRLEDTSYSDLYIYAWRVRTHMETFLDAYTECNK